jgi:glycosyltransferase involved in cell wall biosynthesis
LKYKNTLQKVYIGLPVYNGSKTIEKAINSVLAQTFQNFELVISDNASNDETAKICKEFLLKDSRIKYIRQKNNIGVSANMKFLLEKANEEYFMWIGSDDWISPEFLEANVSTLQSNLKYVASTSPNCFEGEEKNYDKYIKFSLRGAPKERYVALLQNAFSSHGIFYSLMRTEIVKNFKNLDFSYTAGDWSLNFFLSSKGEINRTKEGLLVLGKDGVSMSKNSWKIFRNRPIEFFIPLYKFSKFALGLMKNLNYCEWTYVFFKLLKVNLQAMKSSYTMTIKEFIK